MRRGGLILITVLAASWPGEAAPAARPAIGRHVVLRPVARLPERAPALFAKLMPRLTPAGRDWIGQMSATLRSDEMQPDHVRDFSSQVCFQMLLGCADGRDIAALAFIVLMQSMQDQADDLKDIMADVKAIDAQKGLLRKLHATIDKKLLDAEIDKIRRDIDSQSELGESESLRLQMAMDRLAKMMQALSNLLKKIGDTDSSIIKNLK